MVQITEKTLKDMLKLKSIPTVKVLQILYNTALNYEKRIDKTRMYDITFIFEYNTFRVEYLEGKTDSGRKRIKFLRDDEKISKYQLIKEIQLNLY